MKVQIVKLDKDLPTPQYAKFGDAGMDVYAKENAVLEPGERKLIGTGLKFSVPYGFEMQVRPRSGLALKHGISIVNTPGTIDHGYRGELGIVLINHGKTVYEVKRAERIAQVVFNKVELVTIEEVEELPESERGEGGYGHSGKF